MTERYSLSSGAVSNGTALGTGREGPVATSTATIGYFMQGSGGGILATVEKYTFGTGGVAAGTSLGGTGLYYGTAAGSGLVGIAANGITAAAVLDQARVYTYSGDTVAAGTALGANASPGALSSMPGNLA